MRTPALDLAPFANAVARLEQGLRRHHAEPQDDQLRDGLIQRFEFTYELAHKMLKRCLREAAPDPERYDALSFQDLIREGWAKGLLSQDWPTWRTYREMRGTTSHCYDDVKAREVVAGIPGFLAEAQSLLSRLRGLDQTI